MKKLIIITLVACCSFNIIAQVEIDSSKLLPKETIKYQEEAPLEDLKIIYKSTANGLVFRWAPTNVETWYSGIEYGYIFERMNMQTQQFEPVGPAKIFPWNEDQWKPFVNDENKYMAIAAMSIFGESETESKGFVHVANDQQNRHAYTLLAADLDSRVAEAAGLSFNIDMVDKDRPEMYRLYTIDTNTNISSDTVIVIAANTGVTESLPPELEIIENEKAIVLKWKGGGRNRSNEKFTAFVVERSEDGTNFSPLLDEPFMQAKTNLQPSTLYTTYIDSVDNGIRYHYRVKGIDAFADLSLPSNIVTGMGKDLTAPTAAQELKTTVLNGNKFQLNWTWENTERSSDLQGFNVYRSYLENGTYEKINSKILPASANEFIDENPYTNRLNFYYIESVDNEGNTSQSVYALGHIVDLIPPQSPTNLVGEIDTNGMVLITWDAPADEDVMGYEIFFSNSVDYEFVKKSTPIFENQFFVDSVTLQTLTKDILYKVVAVDYNYNRSDLSESVTVTRPDVIPPAPSVFTDYAVTEEGISFQWAASQSDDLAKIVLLKRELGGTWAVVSDFDMTDNNYLDKNVEEGISYEYSLLSYDKANNTSEPEESLILEALKSFYLPEIEGIELSKKDGMVVLQWDYQDLKNHDFLIYKAASDGIMETYKVVEGENTLSLNFQKEKQYSFAIKARGNDGRESRMSDQVTLK